jgi:hypothetical protein
VTTSASKRKPGRPVGTAKATSRRWRLELRLTDAERVQWQAAAEREVLTLSEWVRAACELAIARGSTR